MGLPAMRGVCTVEGCDRHRAGRGLCSKHWQRWRYNGTTEVVYFAPGEPLLDKLIRYIDASGDCWEWTGAKTSAGYGQVRIPGGPCRGAHRMVWWELVGPIPEDRQIDHLCRNRRCVNPDHLELVTPSVNSVRRPPRSRTTLGQFA